MFALPTFLFDLLPEMSGKAASLFVHLPYLAVGITEFMFALPIRLTRLIDSVSPFANLSFR